MARTAVHPDQDATGRPRPGDRRLAEAQGIDQAAADQGAEAEAEAVAAGRDSQFV